MVFFNSIRGRLILMVLALLLPGGLFTYVTVAENRQLQIVQLRADLLNDARQARTDLQSDIRTLAQTTALLDLIPAVHDFAEPGCSAALAKLLENPNYLGAVTLDAQGMSRCNGLQVPGASTPKSYAERDYFVQVMSTGQPTVGKPVSGRLTGKPALPVASPIRDTHNTTIGMIATALDLNRFGQRFVQARAQPDSVFLIWDRTGQVLFRHPDAEQLSGKMFGQSPLVRATAQGGNGTLDTIGFDGVERVVAYAELSDYLASGLFVGITVPAVHLYGPANATVRNAAIGLAVIATAAALLAWLIGKHLIWQPVNRVVEAAKRLTGGDYTARVGTPTASGEMGTLAQAFDHMAQTAQLHRQQWQDMNATLEQKVLDRTEKLRASETLFRGVLESAADGVVIVDTTGTMVIVNATMERLFGYRRDELIGQPIDSLVPASYRHEHQVQRDQYSAQAVARGMGERGVVKGLRKDGSEFFAGVSLSPVVTAQETLTTAVVRDISHAIAAERELKRLNRTLRVLSQCNEALVRAVDVAELLEAICRTVVETGGYRLAWVGMAMNDELFSVQPVACHGAHLDYVEYLDISWADTDRGRGPTGTAIRDGRTVIAHKIRSEYTFSPWRERAQRQGFASSVALPLKTREGVLGALNLYSSEEDAFTPDEVTLLEELADDLGYGIHSLRESARRAGAERQLDYQANFDTLTGLPNRALLLDRLGQALRHAERRERQVAVVLLDLDRFKAVNESHGLILGDQLLKEVGRRLVGSLREGDTVARLSVDEFAVLLTDMGNDADAATLTTKLQQALVAPVTLDGAEVFMTASAGIAMFPRDAHSGEALVAHAVAAMHSAKSLGGNAFHFYAPEMNQRAASRLALEGALRRAIEHGELQVHYQPVVDVLSGRICGAEALARWPHPAKGMIPPADFIPLAEDTGLIVALGTWVLRSVCRQMRAWLDAGLAAPPVAVNLSARQFRQESLVQEVREALRDYELDASMLALEITESTIMTDVNQAIATLQELKSIGVRLSLDDFGTGYSSLSYLKRFGANCLKIDRSFVCDITTDADDAAICKAVIGLAHNLKMKVIAEGVETPGQMKDLRQLACDEMQGFWFSRPLPSEDFAQLLTDGSANTALWAAKVNPA